MIASKSTVVNVTSGLGLRRGRDNFLRTGGPSLIADLIARAELPVGIWEYRLIAPFHASGSTPPLQVRTHAVNGVNLWCKPGDNGTGVKGVLIVERDKGISAEDVCKKLMKKVGILPPTEGTPSPRKNGHAQVTQDTPNDVPAEELVEDDELALVLVAVDAIAAHPEPADYVQYLRAIGAELGGTRLIPDIDEAIKLCVAEGWLRRDRLAWQLTLTGRSFIEETMGSELGSAPIGSLSVAGLPAATPLPAAPSAPLPAAPVESIASKVLRYKDKLTDLLKVGDKLSTCRTAQADIKKKIKNLEHDLQAQINLEAELSAGINISALESLFGPPPKEVK